jgi:hypothetical protein
MLGFIGAHYVEMVVVAVALFTVALFSVSLADGFGGPKKSG